MGQLKRLHLGCAYKTPTGWINMDGSWNARLAKYPVLRKILKKLHVLPNSLIDMPWRPNIMIHDVRKPLPFQDNSMSAVYASHLLEHLYQDEANRLLRECFRVLEPCGVLRLVVPDLQAIVLEYQGGKLIGEPTDPIHALNRADRLNRRLLMREPESKRLSLPHKLYTALTNFHSHKWMNDAESLIAYVQAAGFVQVQEKKFLQSSIEGIGKVEEAERVINGAGVCVEGIKPQAIQRRAS